MPFPPLPPPLAEALAARGYAEPTSVQSAVLAEEWVGRDLLVSARTGSGKTVAFGLAMAAQLLDAEGRPGVPGRPKALVVAPTRELAMQVQRELAWLYARSRVLACVGGMDPRREARLLRDGVHIVVGTPGRLCDHLDRGNLDLDEAAAVVLDEADEMLDLGFREELEQILLATPEGRRTLLFSATVPPGIEQIAARYQKQAARIAVAAGEAHADIEYRAVLTVPREREHAVVNVLRFMDSPGALVFCHTREGVNHLHGNLLERGFSVVALSGELTQAERNRALGALRDRRARVCVATDVAARGIDLPDLGLIIHADMPKAAETLLHRSGRTGRAGKKGLAAVIVPYNRRGFADRLFREARVSPRWIGPPPAEQIRERDDARLVEEVRALATEVSDEDRSLARTILEGAEAEALVATLVRARREALPAPEEVTPWNAPPPQAVRPERPEPQRPSAARPAESAESPPPRSGGPARPSPAEGGKPVRRPPADGSAPVRRPPPPPQGVWFRINVGHKQRADPKWLVPMLCRRGNVDKSDLCAFRVFKDETRVLVRTEVAERFFDAASRPDRQDPRVRILPV